MAEGEMAPIVSPGDPGYVPPEQAAPATDMATLLEQVAARLDAPAKTTADPMSAGVAATGMAGALAIVIMGTANHFGIPMDISYAIALTTLMTGGMTWVVHRFSRGPAQ